MSERQMVFQFADPEGERLDHFLVAQLPEFTRSRIQGLIRDGRVRVNGKPAFKTGQWLEGAVEVEVAIPSLADSGLVPEAIVLDVIYEDAFVILVNKPAGMVVHPSAGHSHGTLVHAVLGHAPDLKGVGGEHRPGLVHRLDKNTSGLIILAKDDASLQFLQQQFAHRKVEKTYLALVDGQPPTPEGRIEAPIGRDPSQRQRMAVTTEAKGREGISEYATIESFRDHTLLQVKILTGRTHQIRVHLAFLGVPVVSDTVYGRRKSSLPLKRQFLHAWRLRLRLPGEDEPRLFEAPLAGDLAATLEGLRRN